MHLQGLVRNSFFAAATGMIAGCASIVSGRHAEVAIGSSPANAHVAIRDEQGREVAAFQTPGVARLKRNRRYFLPAKYTATIAAPGYETEQVPIRSTANPWLIGNILFGGVPGLVVDGATGAAWNPKPSQIHQELTAVSGPPPVMTELAAGPQEPTAVQR